MTLLEMVAPDSISVVLVNWNGRDDTLRCLGSLAAQSDGEFEIVLVDNGSEDGSIEAIRAEFPKVRIIDTGENLGFAEGTNRGIAETSSAWVATLNNDTVADPRWIEELRRVARDAPARLGMLQSQVIFLGERELLNSTGVLLFHDGHACDRDAYATLRTSDREEEVFCPTAGAALYRRAMLDEVKLDSGFFDRTFFMYFEDVDLGWRCRLSGWESRYIPSARVHHAFQASSKRHPGRFVGTHLRRNRLRMLLKNGSLPFLGIGLPRSLYEICELVVWHGPGALGEVGRALIDGLSQRRAVNRLVADSGVARRQLERRWTVAPPESLSDEIAKQLRKLRPR